MCVGDGLLSELFCRRGLNPSLDELILLALFYSNSEKHLFALSRTELNDVVDSESSRSFAHVNSRRKREQISRER